MAGSVTVVGAESICFLTLFITCGVAVVPADGIVIADAAIDGVVTVAVADNVIFVIADDVIHVIIIVSGSSMCFVVLC